MNSVEINKNTDEIIDNVVPQSSQRVFNTTNDWQVPNFDMPYRQISSISNWIGKVFGGWDVNTDYANRYQHAYDLWKALYGKKIDMIGLKNAGLNPLLAVTNSLTNESALNKSGAIVQSAGKNDFGNVAKMFMLMLMLAKLFV